MKEHGFNGVIREMGQVMEVIIRPAIPHDCAVLARLAAALNGGEGNPTDLFTPDWAEQGLFGDPPQFAGFVAEADGEVVGMALFHDCVNTGFGQYGIYLNDLYVLPDWRRHGIGRKLLARLSAVTRMAGRTFLWWTVKPKNLAGMAFYQALGAGYEPVLAHALGYDAFHRLADEDETSRATGH